MSAGHTYAGKYIFVLRPATFLSADIFFFLTEITYVGSYFASSHGRLSTRSTTIFSHGQEPLSLFDVGFLLANRVKYVASTPFFFLIPLLGHPTPPLTFLAGQGIVHARAKRVSLGCAPGRFFLLLGLDPTISFLNFLHSVLRLPRRAAARGDTAEGAAALVTEMPATGRACAGPSLPGRSRAAANRDTSEAGNDEADTGLRGATLMPIWAKRR